MLGKIKTNFRVSSDALPLLILIIFFIVFELWRLGSSLPHLSAAEVASRQSSGSLHSLLQDAANAPYRLLQHGLLSLKASSFFLRLASIFFSAVITAAMYRLLVRLFGRIIGLFGTLFFVSLPLFAIGSRQGWPAVMLFLPALLMYLSNHLAKDEQPQFAWIWLMAVSAISLYTPGMLWWLLGAAALSYKQLSASLEEVPLAAKASGILIFCLLIAPLIVISSLHPSTIKELLALPPSWPQPIALARHIAYMLAAVFAHNPVQNGLLLGHQPVLNILLLALVIFGGYALFSAARNKALALLGSVVLAVVIAGLNNDASYLAIGVPALMVIGTAGLRYLYIEWRGIFPRNPVPKTFALVLIGLVTLSQLYFSANYVLLAWPHSPQARSHFVLK